MWKGRQQWLKRSTVVCWKVSDRSVKSKGGRQQIVFVGGTCGSVHVESFNKNMKALGVLESKWNPIRQKLVSRLLEEQDKVLWSYFAQKGGTLGQRGKVLMAKVGSMSSGTCTCEVRAESVRNQDT